MPRPVALTDDQRAARRQLDDARQARRERKRDTRRKIVAGAAVLGLAGLDPGFRRQLRELLQANLTRPHDRALFADFLLDG